MDPTEEKEGGNGSANLLPQKRKKRSNEQVDLRHKLDMMCKRGETMEALNFYQQHSSAGTFSFHQYHYNILLHLCASSAAGESKPEGDSAQGEEAAGKEKDTGEDRSSIIKQGLQLLEAMKAAKVPLNEATLTSAARLAAAEGKGQEAFNYVLEMEKLGIEPKLRSFGPALFTLCSQNDLSGAFSVYNHLRVSGILPSEEELSALLRVSVQSASEPRVYEILQALRSMVPELSAETLAEIQGWFSSPEAQLLGSREPLEAQKVTSMVDSKGGGWHGMGWIGSGPWGVKWAKIGQDSVCSECGEKLVTIDLTPEETLSFADSVSRLAKERESLKAEFERFEAWLEKYGPFDAVVDAANVGLFNQNFSGGGFSFNQLNQVINKLKEMNQSERLPLVILHQRRTRGGPADSSFARSIFQTLREANCFYATPRGSNDDWYWLYAAVKYKAILVTNDEMRDHLFQLLGRDIFPTWKERHQVHYSFSGNGARLHLPPPYSVVVQESANGSWHFPQAMAEVSETRKWLCASRSRKDAEIRV